MKDSYDAPIQMQIPLTARRTTRDRFIEDIEDLVGALDTPLTTSYNATVFTEEGLMK